MCVYVCVCVKERETGGRYLKSFLSVICETNNVGRKREENRAKMR